MTAIRPTAFAGQFYPADPDQLTAQIQRFLAAATPGEDGRIPKAVIAPHAGYVYSGPVAASAYVRLMPARGRISRVVLIGPSHRVGFRGLAIGSAGQWASPLGAVAIDRDAVERLKRLPMVAELDQAHAAEHSLEVHIPFLQVALGSFTLVPVVAGEATPQEVAALLDAVWGGPETVIVVSTDLSHYLDYDDCRRADGSTVAAIERLDPAAFGRDSACGRIPMAGLLVVAKRRGMDIVTLDVRNSGDTAGPKDRVVGYGAWALFEPDLVKMAWASIRYGLATGKPLPPPPAPAIFGAVFVTLKKNGKLRGCIGSPLAWRPLAEDVTDNAFKAAFRDPRFGPMRADEVDEIALSVSLLTAPKPMSFTDEADLLAQLRAGIDGLIIEDQGHRALFLPSVWEQLTDKRQFLHHLKLKAGLPADHWSQGMKAHRFGAVEIR